LSTVLVTGGAGYIGAEVVNQLVSIGIAVVVIDNLSSGDLHGLSPEVHFFKSEISGKKAIDEIFERFPISSVFLFSSL